MRTGTFLVKNIVGVGVLDDPTAKRQFGTVRDVEDAVPYIWRNDMKNVEILWNFMHMNQQPEAADVIVGFGCYDEDIPRRCAELWHQGYAPYVCFSGGLGRNTDKLWTKSEAERFAAIAVAAGVPGAGGGDCQGKDSCAAHLRGEGCRCSGGIELSALC